MQGVPVVGVVAPIMNFSRNGAREIELGPRNFRVEKITTTSAACPGITKFTFKPNDPRSVIDRTLFIEYDLEFEFTVDRSGATNGQYSIQIGSNDAPAFMPASSMIQVMSVSLNSNQITLQTQEVLDLFAWIGDSDYKMDHMLRGCPSARDRTQQFAFESGNAIYLPNNPTTNINNNFNAYAAGGSVLRDGNGMDPFRGEGVYYGKGNPRGSVIVLYKTNDTSTGTDPATKIQVGIRTREPLILPPFNVDNYADGLIGLNSLDIQITMGDALRAWTRKTGHPGGTLTNVTCKFSSGPGSAQTGTPILKLIQLVPNDLLSIPRMAMYDYSQINRYETPCSSAIAGGVASEVTSQTIILAQIPEYVYVQIKRPTSKWQAADTPWLRPTVFCRIDQCTVNYGVEPTALAQANTYDLWMQAVKYGLDMTYSEFAYYTGSIVILKFGDNIPLRQGQCPGINFAQTLQLTVKFTDLRPASDTTNRDYSLFITTVSPGALMIIDQKVETTANIFNPAAVQAAQISTGRDAMNRPLPLTRASTMFGNGFRDGHGILGKLGKAALSAGKKFVQDGGIAKVVNYASKATGVPLPPGAQAAMKLAGLAGRKGGAIADQDSMQKRARMMEDQYEDDE